MIALKFELFIFKSVSKWTAKVALSFRQVVQIICPTIMNTENNLKSSKIVLSCFLSRRLLLLLCSSAQVLSAPRKIRT